MILNPKSDIKEFDNAFFSDDEQESASKTDRALNHGNIFTGLSNEEIKSIFELLNQNLPT